MLTYFVTYSYKETTYSKNTKFLWKEDCQHDFLSTYRYSSTIIVWLGETWLNLPGVVTGVHCCLTTVSSLDSTALPRSRRLGWEMLFFGRAGVSISTHIYTVQLSSISSTHDIVASDTHCHISVVDSKHFYLDSYILLFRFSSLPCGPCGFYLGHVKKFLCNVIKERHWRCYCPSCQVEVSMGCLLCQSELAAVIPMPGLLSVDCELYERHKKYDFCSQVKSYIFFNSRIK